MPSPPAATPAGSPSRPCGPRSRRPARRAGRSGARGRRGRSSCSPPRVRKAVSKRAAGLVREFLGTWRPVAIEEHPDLPGDATRAATVSLGQPAFGVLQLYFLDETMPPDARAAGARRLRDPGGARPACGGRRRARSRRSSGGRARCSRSSARRSRASRSHTRSRPRSSASSELLGVERVGRLSARRRAAARRRGARRCRPGTRRSPRGCSRSRSGRCALAPSSARGRRGRRAGARAGRGRRSPRAGQRSVRRRAAARARRVDRAARRLPRRARRSARATSRCSRRSPPSSRSPCRTRACTSGRRSSATALGDVLATEREASRQRERALYEISRSFAQSLSLDTTLDAVTTTIVERARRRRRGDPRARRARRPARSPRAVHVADTRLAASRAHDPRAAAAASAAASQEPLLLDVASATRLGGAHALLVPFLEKGSTAALLPIAAAGELLAELTIVSLDPAEPIDRRDARDRARRSRAGRARDRQRTALPAAEGSSPRRCSARCCRASGPTCRASRSGTRLRVGRAGRRRRRRLRLPGAARRPAGGRARRRHRARDRRDRRHGDGEVRLPVARTRASRSPATSWRMRTTWSSARSRVGKFITMAYLPSTPPGNVDVRERRASRAAARPARRPRRVAALRRPRARHRRAAGRTTRCGRSCQPGRRVVLYTDGVIEARRGARALRRRTSRRVARRASRPARAGRSPTPCSPPAAASPAATSPTTARSS